MARVTICIGLFTHEWTTFSGAKSVYQFANISRLRDITYIFIIISQNLACYKELA